MAQNRRPNNPVNIPWFVIIMCMMSGIAAPVGIALLVAKIIGQVSVNTSSRTTYETPYQTGQAGGAYNSSTRTAQARGYIDVPYTRSGQQAADKRQKIHQTATKWSQSAKTGRILRSVGIGLCALGCFAGVVEFLDYLFLGVGGAIMEAASVGIPLLGIGGALGIWGQTMLSAGRNYAMYARVIGSSDEISIDKMAGALGLPKRQVIKDLKKMISNGYYEGYYIDHERGVFTRKELAWDAPRKQEAAPAAQQEENPADRIRQINDEIADPVVSAKLDQLESLTRRIYEYTALHPEKAHVSDSFKTKYLPKTIKILESYSRFESLNTTGKDIRTAMKDVEAVLDTLIDSFAKQLDMLFADEAFDVSTEISVLNNMLGTDGLKGSPFAKLQEEEGQLRQQGEGE